jgi:hypothetical protein
MADIGYFSWLPQKILEKFEFFPIRCRVQLATEMFQKTMQDACKDAEENTERLHQRVLSLNRQIKNKDSGQKLKTKVRFPTAIASG